MDGNLAFYEAEIAAAERRMRDSLVEVLAGSAEPAHAAALVFFLFDLLFSTAKIDLTSPSLRGSNSRGRLSNAIADTAIVFDRITGPAQPRDVDGENLLSVERSAVFIRAP